MKNYIIYLISILAMSLLLACDRGGEFELGNNTLALTLSCSDITRADDPDPLNENKIVSLDCFFYAASPDATTADFSTSALAHRRISSLNAIGQHTTYISFEDDDIARIFGNSNRCFIYVIANCSSDIFSSLPTSLPTINQLKALEVESDFQTYTKKQSSFVMDSEGNDVVTLRVNDNGTKTLSGNVVLRRTAAKISFTISKFGLDDANDEVEINGEKYTPNYEGIYVIFDNCVYKSHIAPDVVPNDDINDRYYDVGSDEDDDNADDAEGNNGIIRMVTTGGHAPCTLSMPFYSYPSDRSVIEANNPYISLVVPWKAVDEDRYKSYYYKVPINHDGDELKRNIHYKISVQISMLGNVDPDQAVEIAPSYVIFDCLSWNNDPINTSITDFRYLMVEENSYVLNNVNTIEIPYWSSHPCKIVNATIKQADIKTGGDKTISNPELYITLEDDKIIYSKVLDNNYMSKTFDFAPYTIEFTIQHNTTDSTKYQEKITITQYPAIYGDYEENSEYIDEKSNNNASRYTMVNGYYGTGSSVDNHRPTLGSQDFFASCTGLYSGFSPNMYVFTITSVEGTNYVIGDPRTTEIDAVLINAKREFENPGGNNGDAWVTAKALYGAQNRKLQYYYPTDVDYTSDKTMQNSRTENMIAPKFRIASGYSVLYRDAVAAQDIEGMKKRCASYQEDGYPAGRWRLPTKAEFEFIFSQVNQKKLPQIYELGAPYWCAHGVGTTRADNTVDISYKKTYKDGNNGLSVRCVYDDWYWGSEPVLTSDADKKIFTWGDIPRDKKTYAPAIKY